MAKPISFTKRDLEKKKQEKAFSKTAKKRKRKCIFFYALSLKCMLSFFLFFTVYIVHKEKIYDICS